MFGGIGVMLNGNMCAGVTKNDLILRPGEELGQKLVKKPHARPWKLIAGKPMVGFLLVDASLRRKASSRGGSL